MAAYGVSLAIVGKIPYQNPKIPSFLKILMTPSNVFLYLSKPGASIRVLMRVKGETIVVAIDLAIAEFIKSWLNF